MGLQLTLNTHSPLAKHCSKSGGTGVKASLKMLQQLLPANTGASPVLKLPRAPVALAASTTAAPTGEHIPRQGTFSVAVRSSKTNLKPPLEKSFPANTAVNQYAPFTLPNSQAGFPQAREEAGQATVPLCCLPAPLGGTLSPCPCPPCWHGQGTQRALWGWRTKQSSHGSGCQHSAPQAYCRNTSPRQLLQNRVGHHHSSQARSTKCDERFSLEPEKQAFNPH